MALSNAWLRLRWPINILRTDQTHPAAAGVTEQAAPPEFGFSPVQYPIFHRASFSVFGCRSFPAHFVLMIMQQNPVLFSVNFFREKTAESKQRSKTLPAGSEALQAGSEAFPTGSETLPAATLPCGLFTQPFATVTGKIGHFVTVKKRFSYL